MKLIPPNPTQSKRPATRLAFGAAVAGNFLALLLLAVPVPARGQIFVANGLIGTIGEYSTSGATVNASLITLGRFTFPTGIAVSGSDVFVANSGNGTVGEYTTSGATVNANLIPGFSDAAYVAVSGSDLFVANTLGGTIGGTIGEFTTSGATVNASLITGLNGARGIAVSGSDLFVAFGNTIGEYTTSGATVNASLITGLGSVAGIAVSGSDLFVANSDGTIGEYTTSGATVNVALITLPRSSQALAIAVSGSDLFVSALAGSPGPFGGPPGGTIGEYTTSGATVNASLISAVTNFAIAVEQPAPQASAPEHPSTLALLAGSLVALISAKRRRA